LIKSTTFWSSIPLLLGFTQNRLNNRWKIEELHKSLKQNVSLCKSPTKTVDSQANHFFAALWGYVELEVLKLTSKLNHFVLKSKLYIKALQQSSLEWQSLKSF